MLDYLKKFFRDNPRTGILLVLIASLPVLVFLAQQVNRYRSKAAGETVQICFGPSYPCTTGPAYTITATETLVPVWVYVSTGNVSAVDFEIVFDRNNIRLNRDLTTLIHPSLQPIDPALLTSAAAANSTGRIRIPLRATSLTNLPPNPFKLIDLPFVSAPDPASPASTLGLDTTYRFEIVGILYIGSISYTLSNQP
mgnify:CR=1 FL=1